jgi:hypothetical protein
MEIRFMNKQHEAFYYRHIQKCRYNDAYHRALIYCLGISRDTRSHIDSIYDFSTGCVKPECLKEGWQTSGSERVVRLAFNLYCNGTPSVDDDERTEVQLTECKRYSVENIFCCGYAPYFIEAVKVRYAEYF